MVQRARVVALGFLRSGVPLCCGSGFLGGEVFLEFGIRIRGGGSAADVCRGFWWTIFTEQVGAMLTLGKGFRNFK